MKVTNGQALTNQSKFSLVHPLVAKPFQKKNSKSTYQHLNIFGVLFRS
jgi:hypothetical protein